MDGMNGRVNQEDDAAYLRRKTNVLSTRSMRKLPRGLGFLTWFWFSDDAGVGVTMGGNGAEVRDGVVYTSSTTLSSPWKAPCSSTDITADRRSGLLCGAGDTERRRRSKLDVRRRRRERERRYADGWSSKTCGAIPLITSREDGLKLSSAASWAACCCALGPGGGDLDLSSRLRPSPTLTASPPLILASCTAGSRGMDDDAGEGVVYGRPQAAACSLLDARPRRKPGARTQVGGCIEE
ncbi:hypothetical protein DFH08DRAFT_884042 [Mycena albidolilacea]|uniref:Uncharacterized protein n=1 Tax=Mycena albidolilacea TaxID=1033008 RepID=A0AAD6ZM46_9AGAR|nr:hypothetical protein DFH08DRAFT_884042 [Mycena albidolilacea]